MSDLSEQLARAAGDAPGPLDVDDLCRRADRRRRRTRTVRTVGIVAAALVVVAATVAALSQRSTSTDVTGPERTGTGVGEPGKWVPIAEAPIRARRNAVSVWTGSEVLVFGGFASIPGDDCYQDTNWPRCEDGSSGALRSGAAYDPGTDTWRRIAPLPSATSVWQPDQEVAFANIELGRLGTVTLDGRVYTVAHAADGRGAARLLSYDVDDDVWKVVATLPGSPGPTWALTNWDGRLVTYQVEPGTGTDPRIFDPATGAWTELPSIPRGDTRSSDATIQFIGKGTRLYAFTATTTIAGTPPVPRYVERVSVFDGTRWQTFSHPGGSGALDAVWAATGDTFTMVVPYRVGIGPTGTTSVGADPTEGPLVLTFDPATRAFAEPTIPDEVRTAPVSVQPTVVSNGRRLALVGTEASPIYDGATDTWSVATGPTNEQIDELSATWAGDRLFVWGGTTLAGDTYPAAFNDRGWIWTPPSGPTDLAGPERTGSGVGEPGTWVPIAKAPIQARRNAVSVWTGSDVLVFGGFTTPASDTCPKTEDWPWCAGTATTSLRTGAAYDPTSDSWRRIAPLPAGTAAYQPVNRSRSHAEATGTGTDNAELRRLNTQVLDGRVYVLAASEKHPNGPALLAYDVGADRWSVVTTLEGTGVETWALTAWGGKLVVYVADGRTRLARDRIFDPTTRQWSDASEPPDGDATMIGITPSMPRQMLGVGSDLYVFATTDQVPPGEDRVAAATTLEVAVFDGTHWSLVQHTMAPVAGGIWTATGDHFTFVVPSQLTFPQDASHPPWGPTIVTFDPSTQKFEEPEPPDTADTHLAENDASVIGDGTSTAVVTSTASLVVDGSGAWTVANGPATSRIDDFATVSAGEQLFIWGGTSTKDPDSAATFIDRGWIWTPPSDTSTARPSDSSGPVIE